MDGITELKSLLEDGNKTIAAIRSEVDGQKAKDVVTEEKIGRMEKDLANALSEKAALTAQITAEKKRIDEMELKLNRPGRAGSGSSAEVEAHKSAFLDYMRKGAIGGAEQALFEAERKAADVRVGTAASGGYALPKEIANEIHKQLNEISPIRSISRVVRVSSPDYHEMVDTNGFGTEWLGETDARNQTNTPSVADVSPTFGEITAKPHATRHAISDLMFDVEAWLIARGSEAMAKAEGIAFISGNGTNKPTGFLAGPAPVATADAGRAFGTLQFIASGQAAALATNPFDTLQSMKYALKGGHRLNAKWVMNSLVLSELAKIKDADGRFILSTSVSESDEDRLLNKPIVVAEDMPDIAANAFPIAFGDFMEGYLIADVGDFWLVRDELTTTGYVKFPMSRRVGGKLLNTDAIKVLKIAA